MVSFETISEDHHQQPEPPAYAVEPAWIDMSGRTRTWSLKDPEGAPLAVITTKGAALKLAQLLTCAMDPDPVLPPSPGLGGLRLLRGPR